MISIVAPNTPAGVSATDSTAASNAVTLFELVFGGIEMRGFSASAITTSSATPLSRFSAKILQSPSLYGEVSVDKAAAVAATKINILQYHANGHCSQPVLISEEEQAVKTCAQICFSSHAQRIQTPFIANGKLYRTSQSDGTNGVGQQIDQYCWLGKRHHSSSAVRRRHLYRAAEGERTPLGKSTGVGVGGGGGGDIHDDSPQLDQPCSTATALLVLTDDGGWQCRPMYPTLFGGSDGTLKTACEFNPVIHDGTRDSYEAETTYIDYESGRKIDNHSDFASNATFLKKAAETKSIAEYKRVCADPELFFNYPVVCECGQKTDVLGNRLLPATSRRHMKFSGLNECLENPCFMTKVSHNFGKFDAVQGLCTATEQVSKNMALNAVAGDMRTPLVGSTPAMGLILAEDGTRLDGKYVSELVENTSHDVYDESRAKKFTRLAAPVIPALNLDSSNKTRNILYVPVPSMVTPDTRPLTNVSIRPSVLMHRSCLPPLFVSNGNHNDTFFHEPFSTAAFYVEPVADVLVGKIPQKPYEMDLLITESLRNSRLISGNVLGGSELLFSTLLSTDATALRNNNDHHHHHRRRGHVATNPPTQDTGYLRLQKIRSFYNTFIKHRRLSMCEFHGLANGLDSKNVNLANVGTDDDDEGGGGGGGGEGATECVDLPTEILRSDTYSKWDTVFKCRDFKTSGIKTPAETFVIKEGLMLRSYGPYAGMCLAPYFYDMKSMTVESMMTREKITKTAVSPSPSGRDYVGSDGGSGGGVGEGCGSGGISSHYKVFNPLQAAFPTSHSVLPVCGVNAGGDDFIFRWTQKCYSTATLFRDILTTQLVFERPLPLPLTPLCPHPRLLPSLPPPLRLSNYSLKTIQSFPTIEWM